MYYVCIEDDIIVGILGYEPSVPDSVHVVTISDEDYQNINDNEHYFDISTEAVLPYADEELRSLETFKRANEHRRLLNTTDWKVLRHIREKALGIETSLTEEQYLNLEQERHKVAKSI